MTKKSQQPKRGATPLPAQKAKKQWRVEVPEVSMSPALGGWFVGLCVLAAVMYGGQIFYKSWPVQEISVEGRLQVWQQQSIAEHIDWVIGESFFSLNVDQVRQELVQLPLLNKVRVQKRWPGIVKVKVVEDVPVALWNDHQLLSASGQITGIPEGLDVSQLIRMQGPQLQVTQAAHYFRRIQQIIGVMGVRVDRLSMTAVESVQVELSNGWTVEFGRQYFEDRVLRLKELIEHFPDPKKISKVDLRYGKGAAISWRSQQEIG